MQKTERKNSHKDRIFSLPQNKINFGYQKEHQGGIPKEQKESLIRESKAPTLLTANKAREFVKNIDGWQLTIDHKMIYREFIVHDFMAAIVLIDCIARIAEEEKHHPDIHLTQYRNLRVGLTSHDLGGLSEKDFNVAREINSLPIFSKVVNVKQQLVDKKPSIKKPRYEQKDVQSPQRKAERKLRRA